MGVCGSRNGVSPSVEGGLICFVRRVSSLLGMADWPERNIIPHWKILKNSCRWLDGDCGWTEYFCHTAYVEHEWVPWSCCRYLVFLVEFDFSGREFGGVCGGFGFVG